jgi:hypothetical protein
MTRTRCFQSAIPKFPCDDANNLNAPLNSGLLLRVLLLDSVFSCASVNVREQGFLPRWEAGARAIRQPLAYVHTYTRTETCA